MIGVIWLVGPATLAQDLGRSASSRESDAAGAQRFASVWTAWPGAEVYARWGHTAIRVCDPRSGVDVVFNFGTFDFDQPYFLLRFIRGRLDYQLSAAPTRPVLADYQRRGERLVEQVLDLSGAEFDALLGRLLVNLEPENRTYRYEFVHDNCTTRARDAVLASLATPPDPDPPANAQNPAWPGGLAAQPTYRQSMLAYAANDPPMHLGIDLVFGLPAEQRVPAGRDGAYLPLNLCDWLNSARRGGQPLVRETRVLAGGPDHAALPVATGLAGGDRSPDVASALNWPLLLAAGLMILLTPPPLIALLGRSDARAAAAVRTGSGWARTAGAAATLLLLTLLGLAGLVVVGLWLFTEHRITQSNLNVLWAWPTHLLVPVLLAVPAAGGRGRHRVLLRRYLRAYAIWGGLAVIWWWLTPQAMPLAGLFLTLATAAGCWQLAEARVGEGSEGLHDGWADDLSGPGNATAPPKAAMRP